MLKFHIANLLTLHETTKNITLILFNPLVNDGSTVINPIPILHFTKLAFTHIVRTTVLLNEYTLSEVKTVMTLILDNIEVVWF